MCVSQVQQLSFGQTYSVPLFRKYLEKIDYTIYCINNHLAFYVIVVIPLLTFLMDEFISVVIPIYL